MKKISVTILGRIVEGATLEVDTEDYYLDYNSKEDAINNLKKELEKEFARENCESFDGHDDTDFLIEEFLEELEKYNWDIPLEEREPSEN